MSSKTGIGLPTVSVFKLPEFTFRSEAGEERWDRFVSENPTGKNRLVASIVATMAATVEKRMQEKAGFAEAVRAAIMASGFNEIGSSNQVHAIRILLATWIYGEESRQWWNTLFQPKWWEIILSPRKFHRVKIANARPGFVISDRPRKLW